MKKLFTIILAAVIGLTSVPAVVGANTETSSPVTAAGAGNLIAFPGAEGGGMYTTGARGASSPTIYHVTSLADSGAGTLRDAVSKEGRIIVFDVAGTINLTSPLTLSKKNITILGQTAPGDGICISGAPTKINADNIIMRYLRFRMGVYDEANKKYDDDALGGTNHTSNLIVDHCSMSWSTDECCSIYAVKDSTIQWSIMTEPLNRSIHDEGDGIQQHGYGGIWGGVNVSYHHNIVSSANNRFPRVGTSETVKSYNNTADTESLLDVRNNVFYNWKSNNSYGGENGVRVNLVNNYYKEGPASSSINRFYQMMKGKKGGVKDWGTDLAIGGNYYDSKSSSSKADAINQDNTAGVDTADSAKYNLETYDESQPGTATNHTQYIHDYPIYTQTAQEAYESVLEGAGASIARDAVDARAVNDIRNRTGLLGTNGIIDLADLKTFEPITYSGTKAQDTDGDGMPDTYEEANGLNKNDPSDALVKATSGEYAGYYNIEIYSFNLASDEPAPTNAPTPTIDPTKPTPTPAPTATPTAEPTATPTATPEPVYNISVAEDVTNGSLEINGTDTKTVHWEAVDNLDQIGGARTVNLNGSDSSDGTITMFDTTTTIFLYDGDSQVSARGDVNPSISVPVTDQSNVAGSVFLLTPASDGEIELELYIYTNKLFNVYDNTNQTYIAQGEVFGAEGHHTYTFEGKAGNEYYFWADGSKIGLKSASVTGGGIVSKAGETITVNTTPAQGYRAQYVTTTPETAVTKVGENEFTFVMPASDVVVDAEFVTIDQPTPTPGPTTNPDPTATPSPTNPPIYYSAEPALSGTSLTASIVNRESSESEELLFAAAAYEADDILAEVKTMIIPVGENPTNVAFEFSKEYGNIKCYLWSAATLEPMYEVMTPKTN